LDQGTYLADDLRRGNLPALRFPAYAIQNLPRLQNLKETFTELASIVKKDNESKSNYYNHLTEFHAVWFAARTLRLKVIALEHRSSPIQSPNRKGNGSCDILAKAQNTDIYFEVKALSRETLTERAGDPGSQDPIFFEPSLPSERRQNSCRTVTENWIGSMLRKSFSKGADYLICRIPVWSSYRAPGFGARWMHEIFRDVRKVTETEYIVRVHLNVPRFFKGIYLIHNRRYLLVHVNGGAVNPLS
jgi:hypothetical protein